ncbi:hypothetical protein MRB53_003643 [Persea americana]|uniref:Uncharacterized protein n=1 Tax=Persea americana TaxID=3435 RepID=A0ACC2MY04_PERAE|nr:hypothetical protein MRB53_003643 [Persea americana]|eukprot:TRINITY_DN69824_c0_g1_i1.p1 TRINITY_DN69824_c0_g1~~TRINITY_DN69824_c0_g1_i1.p1  ORF type:complete len:361 (-),score=87.35 TRINITY_DN69824_c0_g1_i1:383-1465(-)
MENQPTPTIRPTPRFRFPQPQAPPPPPPQPQQPPPQFQPRLLVRPTLTRLPLPQLLRPSRPPPQQPPQPLAAAPFRPPPPQQPQLSPAVPSQPPPQQQPQRQDVAPPPQIQQVQTAPSSTEAPTPLEIGKPPSPTPKATSQEPTTPQSPKTIKTLPSPVQSPRTKPSPTPPPPPSLPLPPSQLKPEPEPELSKTMLVQDVKKMSESMPRAAPATQKSEFSSNTIPRHSVADVEVPMRVITLAGENKGACMELGFPSSLLQNKKKPETIGTVRLRQQQVEEDDAQGNGTKMEKKNGKGANSTKAPPVASAFVNSNVQSVNNSIVFHASCTHGDPGVHLAFSRKPAPANGYHRKDHPNGHQT